MIEISCKCSALDPASTGSTSLAPVVFAPRELHDTGSGVKIDVHSWFELFICEDAQRSESRFCITAIVQTSFFRTTTSSHAEPQRTTHSSWQTNPDGRPRTRTIPIALASMLPLDPFPNAHHHRQAALAIRTHPATAIVRASPTLSEACHRLRVRTDTYLCHKRKYRIW
jgi:hypothetical protein